MHNKLLMHLMQHHNIYSILIFINFQMSFGINAPKLISYSATQKNEHTQEITIAFTVAENDFIYKDFITLSSYEPTVSISAWKANKSPIAHYDPLFKDTKLIFNENFTISTTAIAHQIHSKTVYLYCSYYRQSEKKINHILIPLFFTAHNLTTTSDNKISHETVTPINTAQKIISSSYISPINDYYYQTISLLRIIITSFKTDHKKYFLLYIILISFLLLLSHFFKNNLKKQIALKELNDVIISCLGLLIIIYTIFYIRIVSTPLITCSLACCCSLIIGLLYIKKSTQLQSGYLRTLCTVIGTLSICGTIFLSFKLLHYY